jgi:hypothetical protein
MQTEEDRYTHVLKVNLGEGVQLGALRPCYEAALGNTDFRLEQATIENNGTGRVFTTEENARILAGALGETLESVEPPFEVENNNLRMAA